MNDLGKQQNMNPSERVETVLREYFHAAMPSVWPAIQLPDEPAKPRPSVLRGLFQNAGRMALAASILALVLGYLVLNAAFTPVTPRFSPAGPNIGMKGDGSRPQHLVPMP